jgi:hypothetical protein
VLLFIIDGDIMEKKEKDLKTFTFSVVELVKKYKKRMEKNYDVVNSEEVKCPNCNWETPTLSTRAKNKKKALETILDGGGLCAECYVEMIDDNV